MFSKKLLKITEIMVQFLNTVLLDGKF